MEKKIRRLKDVLGTPETPSSQGKCIFIVWGLCGTQQLAPNAETVRQPGSNTFSGPVQVKGHLKVRLINGGCLINKDAIIRHDQGISQIHMYRNYSLHANHRVVGEFVEFFVFVLRVLKCTNFIESLQRRSLLNHQLHLNL